MCMGVDVDVDFNSGVSVTAVELAAWTGSDKATRPAAPRSALRTNDFMIGPQRLVVMTFLFALIIGSGELVAWFNSGEIFQYLASPIATWEYALWVKVC